MLPKGGSVMALVGGKISDGIGILTLNNPKKLNSLSKELIDDLCAALEDAATSRLIVAESVII